MEDISTDCTYLYSSGAHTLQNLTTHGVVVFECLIIPAGVFILQFQVAFAPREIVFSHFSYI